MRMFTDVSPEANEAVILVESMMILEPQEFPGIVSAVQKGEAKKLTTERQQAVAKFIERALDRTENGVQIDYDDETWGTIAGNPDYQEAARHVREAGGKSDEMIDGLRRNTALTGLRIYAELYAAHRAQAEA